MQMTKKMVSRAAVWLLGLAGLLSLAPASKAEWFEFSTSVTLSGPTTPGGGTISGTTFNTGVDGNKVTLNPRDSLFVNFHTNGNAPGTDIVFSGIDATSAGQSSTPTNVGFNYTYVVTITDFATKTSTTPLGTGTFTITGRLQGRMGNNQVNIDNLNFAVSPATLPIGGALYTVTVNNNGGYTAPGPNFSGALGAHISATAVPEPASMALVGLGGLGAFGMFRRRRAKSTA